MDSTGGWELGNELDLRRLR
ncbi:uncharacterized protein G2W53_040323 [Senna tora]|uniref:Uncharacterized protein n=1 Tax=Senna tora TaxID=362788 RepID=A0A834W3G5_9FABA|nr:uncharacterized protein G2W53_040323 [Senna tora]